MSITRKQGVRSDFGDGGKNLAPGGAQGNPSLVDLLWSMLDRIHVPVADYAGLAALGATLTNVVGPESVAASTLDRADGMLVLVKSDGSLWRWDAASALVVAGDTVGAAVRAAGDAPTLGRWVRHDKDFDIVLPVDFTKADAAVLWTVPVGMKLQIVSSFQEVTTSWTGGASSAIGLSSSNAGMSTKGDVLGGASGDVLATLVSTGAFAKGTKGTKIGTPGAVLVGGDTLRFDRVTSVFTAGAGNAHVVVSRIA